MRRPPPPGVVCRFPKVRRSSTPAVKNALKTPSQKTVLCLTGTAKRLACWDGFKLFHAKRIRLGIMNLSLRVTNRVSLSSPFARSGATLTAKLLTQCHAGLYDRPTFELGRKFWSAHHRRGEAISIPGTTVSLCDLLLPVGRVLIGQAGF